MNSKLIDLGNYVLVDKTLVDFVPNGNVRIAKALTKSEAENLIVEYAKKHSEFGVAEIEKITGKSRVTAWRLLKTLVKTGFLKESGANKNRKYSTC